MASDDRNDLITYSGVVYGIVFASLFGPFVSGMVCGSAAAFGYPPFDKNFFEQTKTLRNFILGTGKEK